MTIYHKIQSIYKRDPDNNHKTFLMDEFSRWEFDYLKDNEWVGTEKIHGMNMRIVWDGTYVQFLGRSDKADIPKELHEHLAEKYTVSLMTEVFGTDHEQPMVLYGEGCGAGIQKGGGGYSENKTFIMFDISIGGFWLSDENMRGIGEQLGTQVSPIVFRGSLDEAVHCCKEGFNSTWGDFEAEGLVLRPALELVTQDGKRIITKVKCKDFVTTPPKERIERA